MKEFENIVVTSYIIFLILIGTFWGFRYWYYWKTKSARIHVTQEKSPFRYFRYLTLVGLPLFLTGLIHYIFVLQKGNLFAPYWAKLGLITLLTLVFITELRYNFNPLPRNISRILNIVFGSLITFLGVFLNQLYWTALHYPETAACVIIDLPFKGKWIASGAGATALTNHHDRISSQKYAVDIIKFGDRNKLFKNDGIANEDSYTFGAEVISPVDGKIVHVTDDLPDVKIRERDKLAGNYILIQFQDTLYVALAHLKQNSIVVKEGDMVKRGDVLGQVGNSGNTDFPHLHIHVQDTEVYNIETTRSYPFRFRNFKRMRYVFWTTEKNQFLLSNDIIRPSDTYRDGSDRKI